MCDNDESNWVWSLRDRKTRKPITTKDGYAYVFANEAEAHAMSERLGGEIELVHTRAPGA